MTSEPQTLLLDLGETMPNNRLPVLIYRQTGGGFGLGEVGLDQRGAAIALEAAVAARIDQHGDAGRLGRVDRAPQQAGRANPLGVIGDEQRVVPRNLGAKLRDQTRFELRSERIAAGSPVASAIARSAAERASGVRAATHRTAKAATATSAMTARMRAWRRWSGMDPVARGTTGFYPLSGRRR